MSDEVGDLIMFFAIPRRAICILHRCTKHNCRNIVLTYALIPEAISMIFVPLILMISDIRF